jgi:cephalosporin hydroxylase
MAAPIDERARQHPRIELLTGSSVSDATRRRIHEVRDEFPGPVFAILDSDHAADHVEAELALLTPLLVSGDYVVVEDSNLNGHPVMPDYGPGPYEAVERYLAAHPGSYDRDEIRERKFGFTFAPGGFLIRR